jgi:hypothetical protein
MRGWAGRATLGRMDDLLHLAAIAIAFGAALFFAAMAWASAHQS